MIFLNILRNSCRKMQISVSNLQVSVLDYLIVSVSKFWSGLGHGRCSLDFITTWKRPILI